MQAQENMASMNGKVRAVGNYLGHEKQRQLNGNIHLAFDELVMRVNKSLVVYPLFGCRKPAPI